MYKAFYTLSLKSLASNVKKPNLVVALPAKSDERACVISLIKRNPEEILKMKNGR